MRIVCIAWRYCNHSEIILFNGPGHLLGNGLGREDTWLSEVQTAYRSDVPAMSSSSAMSWVLSTGQQGVLLLPFCSQVDISGVRHFTALKKFQILLVGQGVQAKGNPVNCVERLDLGDRSGPCLDVETMCVWERREVTLSLH